MGKNSEGDKEKLTHAILCAAFFLYININNSHDLVIQAFFFYSL